MQYQNQTINSLSDLEVRGKTVLLRTDYNVPLSGREVTDDFRLRATLPTINALFGRGADKLIIISHLGRPAGKIDPELSLSCLLPYLKNLLPGRAIEFVPAITGELVEKAVENLPSGGILLLENLRFDPREEANSADFAAEIVNSTHADCFVQDGFAVVHRAHASTDQLPRLLPSAAGLLLEQEITNLSRAINDPRRPLLVIIGGSKVADKQPLIDHFLPLADYIFVGGKIAADGFTSAHQNIIVASDFTSDQAGNLLDIGEKSTAVLLDLVAKSRTIIWNGVLGQVENLPFDRSSKLVATALGSTPSSNYSTDDLKSQDESHISIICGGDTAGFVQALQRSNPELKYSLISTGGGASLEFLSDLPLPGIAAL